MRWKGFSKRKRIGVIIHQYQYDIWQGLIEKARDLNVDLSFFVGRSLNSPYETEISQNYVYEFADSSLALVDGLLIFSGMIGNFINKEELKNFVSKFIDIPSVSVFMEVENIPSVLIDNKLGMELIMSHLVNEHKYKRFAFIKGPKDNIDAIERYEAFLDCIKKYSVSNDETKVIDGDFRFESGIEALKNLKEDIEKQNIDAIVSANDTMAIGILSHMDISKHGIALTGFDNVVNSDAVSPPLTTVDVNLKKIASVSLSLLLDLMDDRDVKEKTYIEPALIIRESCLCNQTFTKKTGKEFFDFDEYSFDFEKENDKLESLIFELQRILEEGHSIKGFLSKYFFKLNKGTLSNDNIDRFLSILDNIFVKTEQYKKNRQNKFYNEILMLRILTRDISSDINFDDLKKHLIEKLPAIGISDFLMFMNERNGAYPKIEKLKCILFIKDNKEIIIEKDQNLKEIFRFFIGEKNYIFLPLSGKNEIFGIIVINYIENDIVYEILREQLSSTIKYIELFQKNIENEKELEQTVRSLNELKEEYFSMLEFLPSAVFEIDKDFKVEFLNRNARELLMIKEDENNLNFTDFVYPEDRNRLRLIFEENQENELKEVRLLKRSGVIIHFLFNLVKIYEGGKFTGIRISGFDIRPILSKSFAIDDNFFNEYNLSPRERDVLKLWIQGYQIKEIASTLFIAESTVKIHIGSIYSKLDVKNKYEFFEFIKNYQIKRFGYESFLFSMLSHIIKN